MSGNGVVEVLQGTPCALQALRAARGDEAGSVSGVRWGQRFEHSVNLDVELDPALPGGGVRVVNLTRRIRSASQVVVAPVVATGPGNPVQVIGLETAVEVRLDTPRTGPIDPGPALPLLEQWLDRSWFTDEQGRSFGLPRLQAAAGELATGTDEQASRALGGLLGLGAGLTPSGDDVLVAWLAWQRATGGRTAPFDGLRECFRETTRTSATLLACALDGETSEALNQLLLALAAPRRGTTFHRDLAAAVEEVAHTGHSSGADALAGLAVLWQTVLSRSVDGRPGRAPTRPPHP